MSDLTGDLTGEDNLGRLGLRARVADREVEGRAEGRRGGFDISSISPARSRIGVVGSAGFEERIGGRNGWRVGQDVVKEQRRDKTVSATVIGRAAWRGRRSAGKGQGIGGSEQTGHVGVVSTLERATEGAGTLDGAGSLRVVGRATDDHGASHIDRDGVANGVASRAVRREGRVTRN